jgi:TetR/AcrR family transcriptional regulator
MTRLLTGDALAGETERLRERIAQFYDRFEAQLKQVLREAQIRENMKPSISAISLANLLLATCEGRLLQFVRSEFEDSPLEHWDLQWQYLSSNLLTPYAAPTTPSGN